MSFNDLHNKLKSNPNKINALAAIYWSTLQIVYAVHRGASDATKLTVIMTIHNLYIFSKNGTLLYYAEWNRLNKSGITKEEEAKLMYGMLFSIKSFVSKISPLDPKEGFLHYKTSKYTLHYFETPSGLKFVLNTDNATQNARDLLQQLYREVYLEYVVKNPLCQLNEPIQSELFKLKVDELFKKSPVFLNRAL